MIYISHTVPELVMRPKMKGEIKWDVLAYTHKIITIMMHLINFFVTECLTFQTVQNSKQASAGGVSMNSV